MLEGVCDLSIPGTTYHPLSTFFSAWGSEELDGRRFSFWHAGDGLVLDRKAFDEWLVGSAEAAGVTLLRGFCLTGARRSKAKWLLTGLIDGEEQALLADFVVEATGRTAQSVIQPDIRRFFTDRLVCLSVELPGQSERDHFAMVESCSVGWWYTVQLPGGRRIVSLFTDGDLVKAAGPRLSWLKAELSSTSHIRQLAEFFPEDATSQVCDARTSVRNVLWRNTWMSIGDAAWSLDPLSGAGIERAVSDGIDAGTAISQSLTSGNSEPLRSHAVSRANSFRESLAIQRQYYSVEQRWGDTVFWRRRV